MRRIYSDKWLPLENPRITPEGFWESSATYRRDSEWFSGHFDQCPVLPGVALLALTAETVKRHGREQGRLLEISGFVRVRFKRLVIPGEKLIISVTAMPRRCEATLDFHVTCLGSTVASGALKATETLPGL